MPFIAVYTEFTLLVTKRFTEKRKEFLLKGTKWTNRGTECT